jgi:hypothetical protein
VVRDTPPPSLASIPQDYYHTRMSRQPITPHDGTVDLKHDFQSVHSFLQDKDADSFKTVVGTKFTAQSTVTGTGQHVIRFFQEGVEYARAYRCCWGHYYNCNRARIGMYCTALDATIGRP